MSQQTSPGPRSWSLTARLTTLSLLAFAASLLSGGYAAWTVSELNRAQQGEQQLNELSETALQLDELHESLRADLYAAYAGLGHVTAETQDDVESACQSLALDFADGQHGEASCAGSARRSSPSAGDHQSPGRRRRTRACRGPNCRSLRTASAILGEQLRTEREQLEAEQAAAGKAKDAGSGAP